MLTKENSRGGSGAGNARSAYQVEVENENNHCTTCGQILGTINFLRYTAHVCDNVGCCRFRSPQSYTEIPEYLILQADKKRETFIQRDKPSYLSYLQRKKKNYGLLRSVGVDSVAAARMTSDKQTRFYLESIGYDERLKQ